RYLDQFLRLIEQPIDPLLRAVLAWVPRLSVVFREKLQVEVKRADVVLDFVDEPSRKLGHLGEVFGGMHRGFTIETCESRRAGTRHQNLSSPIAAAAPASAIATATIFTPIAAAVATIFA